EQLLDVIEQWLRQLRQVRDLGGPVVHLQVDVGVVVAVPRRGQGVVPQSLQVRRKISGARAADQQVSAHLEVQGDEARIVLAGTHRGQAFVGRLAAATCGVRDAGIRDDAVGGSSRVRRTQAQADAVKKAGVVGFVRRA